MYDKIDMISNEVVNRKQVLNKQLLKKVINNNLKGDTEFKYYLLNGINNDDIHVIMTIKDFIKLNKYK